MKIIYSLVALFKKIINNKIKSILTEEHRYIVIIIFWILLLIEGYITENRLITFCEILIIISIYKIIHKNIDILYKNFNLKISQEILLTIYKYKNPLIWLIIEMELKIFYIMYWLKQKNVSTIYINIMYNILYNFTGFDGLKIVLYKIYKVLNDWKTYTIYEIIFKRMYGMILSILIFTNIIQLIIIICKTISTSYILWFYILLLLISYLINTYSIIDIEYIRKDTNLIWTIFLKDKDIKSDIINQNLNSCLGLTFLKEKLNYKNYFKYLILSLVYRNEIEYYKPSYLYCKDIQKEYFNTFSIFAKNAKLRKQEKNKEDIDLINYCEYNILKYKLRLYYLWDVEKELEIKQNLITIEIEDIDWIGDKMFSYDYNFVEFTKIYHEKIKNVKLNKFWDLVENYEFYEKMLNYLYDYKFQETKEYEKLSELKRLYYVYDRYIEEDLEETIWISQKTQELLKQLEDFRKEWEKWNIENMEEKYYNIFKEIDIIKNKYLT